MYEGRMVLFIRPLYGINRNKSLQIVFVYTDGVPNQKGAANNNVVNMARIQNLCVLDIVHVVRNIEYKWHG